MGMVAETTAGVGEIFLTTKRNSVMTEAKSFRNLVRIGLREKF